MDQTTTILSAITVASMLMAILCAVIAFRAMSYGRTSPVWRTKANSLDRKLSRLNAVLGAYPGLLMIWDRKEDAKPRLLGSTSALASIRRFAVGDAGRDQGLRILAGLDDLELVGGPAGETRLSTLLTRLREKGEAFSVALILPEGGAIDVTGRVAGAQALLWFDDPSLHTQDESEAIQRLDANRSTALRDPLAFIEMLDRAGFPSWRIGTRGEIRWANPAYVTAVGADTLATVLKDQTQLDSDTKTQAAGVLATGERTVETRPIVARGQRRAMTVSLFPVSGGAAGVAIDATEADGLRSALMSHVRAHDETLNALTEGVVIFGPDQRMRFHNTAFSTLFNLDESFYSNSPSHGEWLDSLRENRRLPERADYRSWKKDELDLYTNWPSEMPDELWTLPDGRTLRVVRQRDPEGGLLLLFADMTDQLTLKSELGTLINVQRTTLDRLSDGIAVFGTDGRLRLSNSAFANLWRLPEASLAQSPRFADITPAMQALYRDEDFWTELGARVTDPNPDVRRMVEGELTRTDGKFLTWLSRPLPDGATLVAFNDRTQAKQAEDALIERTEALEEANRIKSEFVGHVSYQLRTPLTTIKGYADFLQDGAIGDLNDRQSEYLFSIQTAAGELAKSIDDILDIAAIEANVLDLDLGDVDIHELLDNTLDYVATRAEDTRISLHLNCDRDIGVIRADGTRLKQVVYNLLLNALRFTKPGGHIEIGADRADGGLRLWVKDNGVGIPTERQPRVFESFQSSRGGTGLGLALVQKFVERHGGWVDLESEEGQGTHVTCYLPTVASSANAHPELDLAAQ